MAKNPYKDILFEVQQHYRMWKEDNDKRRTRKGGWNDVTDAYWGKLPSDWPYISRIVDPVIRTSLNEKNARLLNAKLRGRLVPREGGDVLKARLNNVILDFQWDSANDGGAMLSKWKTMDLDSRLYASKFALVLWKHEEDKDGKVIFDGNEFTPLDVRDSGIDPTATHIRNAKWFQHRKWAKLVDLERVNETGVSKKYPGLALLKTKIDEYGQQPQSKDNEYEDRVKQNKGLQDRTGEDKAFPVVELVTEYRKDRWITFCPKYGGIILRDIENPYDHGQIPVVQLRYYPLGDDVWGESEVEPVIPLWKGIQATLCGYVDNMNIHMRPPLKLIEGAVTIETIVWGAEAQWMMTRPDAVTEMQSNGEAMRYFQTTYSALKAAFNTAMGDASQGVGGVDPFNPDKTATEIKFTARQQNVRDQSNQTDLGLAISDMMMMWLSNNKQFLFVDPNKHEYVLRIVGTDMFNYFKRAGLDEMEVSDENMTMLGDIIKQTGGNMNEQDIQSLFESAKQPKFPVFTKMDDNPENIEYKPKMEINDMGDGAELSIVPEDLQGTYDYIADTVSMQSGASEDLIRAQQQAISDLTQNQGMIQLLQAQGVQPEIKELLINHYENIGLKDAERYFTTQQPAQPGLAGGNGLANPMALQGIPGAPPPQAQGGLNPAMAGPAQVPLPGGIPTGV